jgi:hypothetical protein
MNFLPLLLRFHAPFVWTVEKIGFYNYKFSLFSLSLCVINQEAGARTEWNSSWNLLSSRDTTNFFFLCVYLNWFHSCAAVWGLSKSFTPPSVPARHLKNINSHFSFTDRKRREVALKHTHTHSLKVESQCCQRSKSIENCLWCRALLTQSVTHQKFARHRIDLLKTHTDSGECCSFAVGLGSVRYVYVWFRRTCLVSVR